MTCIMIEGHRLEKTELIKNTTVRFIDHRLRVSAGGIELPSERL